MPHRHGDGVLLFSGANPAGNVHRVARALRREQSSLFNCLNSIVHDHAFVEEIRGLYPSLPLLANLRCGLWYASAPDGTCYFKSTDGHAGNWGFSVVRLNWHVAHMSAAHGGLLMVDATRKGKTFTDAFSKTVPIWCAVVNRAIARVRAQQQHAAAAGPHDAATATTERPHACGNAAACGTCSPCGQPCKGGDGCTPAEHSCTPEADEHFCGGGPPSRSLSLPSTSAPAPRPHHPALNKSPSLSSWFAWARLACPPSPTSPLQPSPTSEPSSPSPLADAEEHLASALQHHNAIAAPLGGAPGSTAAASACTTSSSSTLTHVLETAHHSSSADSLPGAAVPDTLTAHREQQQTAAACPSPPSDADRRLDSSSSSSSASPSPAPGSVPWDCSLHLPLWVPRGEAMQIEALLEGWVDDLMAVGADIRALEQVLTKPLRPLWISQSSLIWLDQVCPPGDLPFTPLILISASQPHSYERKCSLLATGAEAGAAAAAAGPGSRAASGAPATRRGQGEGGRVRWRSQGQAQRKAAAMRRRSGDGARDQDGSLSSSSSSASSDDGGRNGGGRGQRTSGQAWTYVYVPGAGDDEESWAAGLTPELFWRHCPDLLGAGPSGVHDAVKALLRQEQEQYKQGHVPAVFAAGTHGTNANADAAAAAVASARHVETDEDHLKPRGCVVPGEETSVQVVGPGIHLLGATRIALGSFSSGAAPDVWRHVGAVLNCGTTQHPSMAAEAQGRQWATAAGGVGGSVGSSADGAAGRESKARSGEEEEGQEEEEEVWHDAVERSDQEPVDVAPASQRHLGVACGDGMGQGRACFVALPAAAEAAQPQGGGSSDSSGGSGSPAHRHSGPLLSSSCSDMDDAVRAGEEQAASAAGSDVPPIGAYCSRCISTPDFGAVPSPVTGVAQSVAQLQCEGCLQTRVVAAADCAGSVDATAAEQQGVGSACRTCSIGVVAPAVQQAAAAQAVEQQQQQGSGQVGAGRAEELHEGWQEVVLAGEELSFRPFPSQLATGEVCAVWHAAAAAGAVCPEGPHPLGWAAPAEQQQSPLALCKQDSLEDELHASLRRWGRGCAAAIAAAAEVREAAVAEAGAADSAVIASLASLRLDGANSHPASPAALLLSRSAPAADTVLLGADNSSFSDGSGSDGYGGAADAGFTFCSSPRGLPCEPFISVALECPRDELHRMRRATAEADAARDAKREAAMNRESASRVGRVVRQAAVQAAAQRQARTAAASVAAAAGATAPPPASPVAAPQPEHARYLWLPIEGCKQHRTSLLDHLAPALEFASWHISQGHTVLLHDALGLDQSVCIAVALLLACYDCNPSSASGKGDLPAEQPQQQAGSGDAPSRLPPVFLGRLRVENGEVLPADGRQVTKHSVRQALALVSCHYPQARPTRGMLRQVFNFFEQRRPGGQPQRHT